MASFNPGMEHWRNTLAQRLPTRLRSVFQASARNNLLKQVNVELLVFNDRLYDLRNGSWRQLELQGSRPDAVQLAQAAAQLLGEYGWRSVFHFGAAVTAAFIPIVFFLVPESVHWLARKQPTGALDASQHRGLVQDEHPAGFQSGTATCGDECTWDTSACTGGCWPIRDSARRSATGRSAVRSRVARNGRPPGPCLLRRWSCSG